VVNRNLDCTALLQAFFQASGGIVDVKGLRAILQIRSLQKQSNSIENPDCRL
jgi:hypothetical protein